jgi:hypothetical protein
MVQTQIVSIKQNSRGFFLRERDTIHAEHGVSLKFPQGRGHQFGDYQDMVVVGPSMASIKSVMPKIRSMIETAEQNYQDYVARRNKRKMMNSAQSAPSTKNDSPKVERKVTNAFAALDGYDQQEKIQQQKDLEMRQSRQNLKDAISNGTAPKVAKAKVSTMNYAAMASKSAPVVQTWTPTSRIAADFFPPLSSRSPSPEPYCFHGEDYAEPDEWFDWSEEA